MAPIGSLLTAGTNRSIIDKFLQVYPNEKFDTVIVDDANLIHEIEIVQGALRFGCQRLLLLGNKSLVPECFSLSNVSEPPLLNKTLFHRVLNTTKSRCHFLRKPQEEEVKVMSKKPSSRKRASSAKKAEEPPAPTLNITFINVSDSKPVGKKESYINEPEAKAIAAHYKENYKANKNDPNQKNVYLSSPFRTQAHQIKTELELKDKKLKVPEMVCMEDMVSGQAEVLYLSLCHSSSTSKMMNSPEIISFLLSRFTEKLIIFGVESDLNKLWKDSVLSKVTERVDL